MVIEYIGIYNADGGIRGEVAYVLGSIFAGRSCALCDITHAWVSEKRSFKEGRGALEAPLTLLHLNEQPEPLRDFTEGIAPCVVARLHAGFEVVFTADELTAMGGDERVFFEALSQWRPRAEAPLT